MPMTTPAQISAYVDALCRLRLLHLFNPYADYNLRLDISRKCRDIRAEQLYEYLCLRLGAKLILCAEAMGFQGGRFSGIPMTSERILTSWHDIPYFVVLLAEGIRTSQVGPTKGFTEITASIVWRTMRMAGINPYEVILTNTLMLHPYNLTRGPLSNRAPTADELLKTRHLLEHFFSLFPSAAIVPLGRVAEETLRRAKIACRPYVRHPANGGATLFRQGMVVHWSACSPYRWP
jgi:hypothetical protein